MRYLAWILLLGLCSSAPRAETGTQSAYRSQGLQTSTGASTTLAGEAFDHRLVVVVMKGTWCSVCTDQLRRLQALTPELGALETRVVGLTTDPVDDARELVEQLGLPFEVVSDPTHAVVEKMGLWNSGWGHPIPSMIVYDRCGKERGRIRGRNGFQRPEPAVLDLLSTIDPSTERCSAHEA